MNAVHLGSRAVFYHTLQHIWCRWTATQRFRILKSLHVYVHIGNVYVSETHGLSHFSVERSESDRRFPMMTCIKLSRSYKIHNQREVYIDFDDWCWLRSNMWKFLVDLFTGDVQAWLIFRNLQTAHSFVSCPPLAKQNCLKYIESKFKPLSSCFSLHFLN